MKQQTKIIGMLLIVALASLLSYQLIIADPDGADITYINYTMKGNRTPDSRTDGKGTITTLIINTVQQNMKWKAYVGNVSGKLVLRDAEEYSIYEWPAQANPDGVVYITMNDSIDWASIQCANTSDIQTQQTHLGHNALALDNINNTFSEITHQRFDVGAIPIETTEQCWTAYPWVNHSAQTPSTTALYQEVLLMDIDRKLVYATMIDQDADSYKNDTITSFDFQAIVPDYTTAANALYYFYVEISG